MKRHHQYTAPARYLQRVISHQQTPIRTARRATAATIRATAATIRATAATIRATAATIRATATPTRASAAVVLLAALVLLPAPATYLAAGDTSDAPGGTAVPTRIILFIGDGMGTGQLEAASLFVTGEPSALAFQSFPVTSTVATDSLSRRPTDSAAASTAIATGTKVRNGALSVERPGSRDELTTIFELAKAAGLSTGFVTTTYVTHATPAGFAAHEPRRNWHRRIARDILTRSRPNVVFGGAGGHVTADDFREAGYAVATDSNGLLRLASGRAVASAAERGARREAAAAPRGDAAARDVGRYAALLGDGHLPYVADGRPGWMPGLAELTSVAVGLLDDDPDGFLLVVEAGRIDHAGHDNDIARLVPEVVELERTVGLILSLPGVTGSTLVVVTADHETGGLTVERSRGAGELPEVSWSTGRHTAADVPLYATGPGAERFGDVRHLTDIFYAIRESLGL